MLESLQEGLEKSRDPKENGDHRRKAGHLGHVWTTLMKAGPPRDSPSSSPRSRKPHRNDLYPHGGGGGGGRARVSTSEPCDQRSGEAEGVQERAFSLLSLPLSSLLQEIMTQPPSYDNGTCVIFLL